jgi:hypothetical protein
MNKTLRVPIAARAQPAPAASGTGFPLEVTNRGRTLHFDRPPTRIAGA